MGIVVCLSMLLGLLQLTFKLSSKLGIVKFVALQLLFLGLWNAGWYGVQHLTEFWGQAALFSGFFMIVGACLLGGEARLSPVVDPIYKRLLPVRALIIIGLTVSFLLYAVTLIQLNLGMPILS